MQVQRRNNGYPNIESQKKNNRTPSPQEKEIYNLRIQNAHLSREVKHLENKVREYAEIQLCSLDNLKMISALFNEKFPMELDNLKKLNSNPSTATTSTEKQLKTFQTNLNKLKEDHIVARTKKMRLLINELENSKELREEYTQLWSKICIGEHNLQLDVKSFSKCHQAEKILKSMNEFRGKLIQDSKNVTEYKTQSKHITSGWTDYYIDKESKEGLKEIKRDYERFLENATITYKTATEIQENLVTFLPLFKNLEKDDSALKALGQGNEIIAAQNVKTVADKILGIETAEKALYKQLVDTWESIVQLNTSIQTEVAILGTTETLTAEKYLYLPKTMEIPDSKKLSFKPAATY